MRLKLEFANVGCLYNQGVTVKFSDRKECCPQSRGCCQGKCYTVILDASKPVYDNVCISYKEGRSTKTWLMQFNLGKPVILELFEGEAVYFKYE